MLSKNSRRRFLTGCVVAFVPLSGCLFGAGMRGDVESISAQITNDTDTKQVITVELKTSDGTVDFEETYTLAPSQEDGSRRKFNVENPAEKYTITAETKTGHAESLDWRVSRCTARVNIYVWDDSVRISTDDC